LLLSSGGASVVDDDHSARYVVGSIVVSDGLIHQSP
jgi:hypothetical protein